MAKKRASRSDSLKPVKELLTDEIKKGLDYFKSGIIHGARDYIAKGKVFYLVGSEIPVILRTDQIGEVQYYVSDRLSEQLTHEIKVYLTVNIVIYVSLVNQVKAVK